MFTLNALSIAKRLWLLIACALGGIALLATVFLVSERGLILDERSAGVRQTVEIAHGLLAHYHEQAKKGTLQDGQARQQALAAVKQLRYSGQEYFWINDMQPRMVMHPIRPQLDGTDLRRFDLHQLRRRMGLVTQQPLLFDDSIRDNIRGNIKIQGSGGKLGQGGNSRLSQRGWGDRLNPQPSRQNRPVFNHIRHPLEQ